jgi:hypothetical protein
MLDVLQHRSLSMDFHAVGSGDNYRLQVPEGVCYRSDRYGVYLVNDLKNLDNISEDIRSTPLTLQNPDAWSLRGGLIIPWWHVHILMPMQETRLLQ